MLRSRPSTSSQQRKQVDLKPLYTRTSCRRLDSPPRLSSGCGATGVPGLVTGGGRGVWNLKSCGVCSTVFWGLHCRKALWLTLRHGHAPWDVASARYVSRTRALLAVSARYHVSPDETMGCSTGGTHTGKPGIIGQLTGMTQHGAAACATEA